MSLTDNYVPIKVIGNGSTDAWSGNWNPIAAAYLQVFWEDATTHVQTLKVLGTHYTLTFNTSGFTVTAISPYVPTSQNYVVISRKTSKDQTVPYKTSVGFQGGVQENSFDKLTALDQEVQDQLNRAPKFPLGTSISPPVLPIPLDGYGLVWSGTDGVLINTSVSLATLQTQAAALYAIAGNITTVAGIAANVTTVAGDTTDINLVAGSISNVNTVAGSISNVNAVQADLTNINSVHSDLTNIDLVAGDLTNINSVAADLTAIDSVSADLTKIDGVYAIRANVTTVSGISANVTTVAGVSANVTTVAGISANVTSVAGDLTNINNVATDLTNINNVATDLTNINNVAADLTNIDTCATNIAAINAAPTQATNAAASAALAVVYAAALTDTSTTSLAIGTGAKTFTCTAGKQFAAGQFISAVSAANNANYMHGQVTSYSGTTLIVNVTDIGGSGTKTDWNLSVSGSQGATGATGATGSIPIAVAAGTVDAITATPSGVTLSDQVLCAIVSAGANTSTTPTFAPNSLTAHTITARGGAALVAGDIGAAGYVALLEYNLANTRWELLNPAKVVSGDVSGAIAETKGGTNQTSYAAGDILYASATNVLSKLAKGSDTNVLTLASGLPSWAAPAGSSQVVLLATATASTSSTLDFTSLITSSYSQYLFHIENLLSSNGQFQVAFSHSNGSSWTDAGAINGQGWQIATASTTAPTYFNSAAAANVLNITQATTSRTYNGYARLSNPLSSVGTYIWQSVAAIETGTLVENWAVSNTAGTTVNAVRFSLTAAANFTSGKIYLYGIKNT